jgi:hypothetical protein
MQKNSTDLVFKDNWSKLPKLVFITMTLGNGNGVGTNIGSA